MSRKEELFAILRQANRELEELRAACKHETKGEANFAWERPPNIHWSLYCLDCHEPLKMLGPMRISD